MTTQRERQVLDAAARIVSAYGRHARDDYFALFAPEASFIFYTADRRLESRAEYEELWDVWERESGFHVLDCTSANQRVDIHGEVGVFAHDVHTRLHMDGADQTVDERETIVFARQSGRWIAVHEHLSSRPAAD